MSSTKPVTFYDAHPGVGGALACLPEFWKIVADWLVDRAMTVEEALDVVREAIPNDVGVDTSDKAAEGCILVTIGSWDNPPKHCWRLVRFRPGDFEAVASKPPPSE